MNMSLASRNKQNGAATETEAADKLLPRHVNVRGSFRVKRLLKNTRRRHEFVSGRPDTEHAALLEHFTKEEYLFKSSVSQPSSKSLAMPNHATS